MARIGRLKNFVLAKLGVAGLALLLALKVRRKSAEQTTAFFDVKTERDYQDTLWGSQRDDLVESETSFVRYINEYANNEVVRGKKRTFRERMVKVAALAIAAVERNDRLAAAEEAKENG